MIKLFSSSDIFLFQTVKSELDALNIPYMVKNEFASGAMGELPWQEAQPELWLIDEGWFTKANKVVSVVEENAKESAQRAWQCSHCHEHNGGAFDVCWQCNQSRPN